LDAYSRLPAGATSHEDKSTQVTTRHLNDGRAFEIVKVFYEPAELAARFAAAGWSVDARATPTYFIYGRGTRL